MLTPLPPTPPSPYSLESVNLPPNILESLGLSPATFSVCSPLSAKDWLVKDFSSIFYWRRKWELIAFWQGLPFTNVHLCPNSPKLSRPNSTNSPTFQSFPIATVLCSAVIECLLYFCVCVRVCVCVCVCHKPIPLLTYKLPFQLQLCNTCIHFRLVEFLQLTNWTWYGDETYIKWLLSPKL